MQEPGLVRNEDVDREQSARLRKQWKEFLAQVKAEHGPQVVAALNAVRGRSVSGGVAALYFGSNEFSRNKCLLQANPLAIVVAEHLGAPAITWNCSRANRSADNRDAGTLAAAG
jgi:hypothetical protein